MISGEALKKLFWTRQFKSNEPAIAGLNWRVKYFHYIYPVSGYQEAILKIIQNVFFRHISVIDLKQVDQYWKTGEL